MCGGDLSFFSFSLLAQNLENEDVLGSSGNSSFNNLFKIRFVFIGML